MLKPTLVLLTLFSTLTLFAQEVPKFGKIPSDLIEMSVYSKDSSADAAILFDIGAINFVYNPGQGWKMVLQRRTVIKIFNKEGYKWADQQVELYHNDGYFESVEGLKGITYNIQNGKIVKSKLDKSSVFTEETNKYWNKEKFIMPDVREGSVIEFTYRLVSDYFFNLKTWNFQHSIPTAYSQITTKIPEYYKYKLISQGYYPYSTNELSSIPGSINYTTKEKVGGNYDKKTEFSRESIKYQINVHNMVVKNIPSMKEESFTSSIDNYRMKVDFELESTRFPNQEIENFRDSWATLNKKFLESQSFGKAINRVSALKNELEVIAQLESDSDKLSATYDLIRTKIAWNGFYSRFTESTLNQALSDGSGNIADINLALTGALRNVGIEAYPVLSSTRSNGVVKKSFPHSKQFNYVLTLVKIDDKEILLDAGDKKYPMGFLPEYCINGEGWAVTEDGGRWVDIGKNAKSKTSVKTTIDFESNNNVKAKIKIEKDLYAGFEDRNLFNEIGKEEYAKNIESKYDWKVIESHFENTDAATKPLVESYVVESSATITRAGDLLLIKPLIVGAEKENPFKNKKREYPVDFTFPRSYAYQGKIVVPEGFEITELPEPLALALPNKKGRFLFSAVQKNNEIVVTSVLNIKGTLFIPAEYPFLQDFYSQIVSKQNEDIILKKK